MAAAIVPGQTSWRMARDSEGHREYKIKHLVRCAVTDGPAEVLRAGGLPRHGDAWDFDGDSDPWAYCLWDAEVTPVVEGEPNDHFWVEQTFSSKPPDTKACKDQQVEDPLLEPPKISGSFTRFTEEAAFDRFGRAITNSAGEPLRGPQVEFDKNRPTVKVEQNVPSFALAAGIPSQLVDCVNYAPLWGFPARTVKLSGPTWEQKFYGQCQKYYTRTLEFEVNYATWDRDLMDVGTLVLNGHWGNFDTEGTINWVLDPFEDGSSPDPDPSNLYHFIRHLDKDGNPKQVVLDGAGAPVRVLEASSEGYSPPGTTGNFTPEVDGAVVQWSNTDNIKVDDANEARADVDGPGVRTYKLFGKNFGFTGPPNTASVYRVEGWLKVLNFNPSAVGVVDAAVEFFNDSGALSPNLAKGDNWSDDVLAGVGFSRYYSWTPAAPLLGSTVKGSDFGLRVSVTKPAANDGAAVFFMAVKIFWQFGTFPGKIHVEKYDGADFISLLGVPATL